MARTIYTHLNCDLDAVASVFAVRRFVDGFADARVKLVPANWNGAGMKPTDVAVDIHAGGKGIKGVQKNGAVHSCFAFLVTKHASHEDREGLALLTAFVDAQDAFGSAVKRFAPNAEGCGQKVLMANSLHSVLRALQARHRDDLIVIQRMTEVLEGLLVSGRARCRARKEADNPRVVRILPCRKVAIITNSREYATNQILFEERGVKMAVFVERNNLGVIKVDSEKIRVDHPAIRKVVETAGELEEWFAHPAGFLFCRGSRKAPAKTRSKVNPMDLARAAAGLF